MKFYFKVMPNYASFKSIVTWKKGDKISQNEARNGWQAVEKWFVAYRDATNFSKHAFDDVETSVLEIEREDLIRQVGGGMTKELIYQLSYRVDISDSALAEEFKKTWWNGATTDSGVFDSISDL